MELEHFEVWLMLSIRNDRPDNVSDEMENMTDSP